MCKGADRVEADTAADCQTWCNMDDNDPEGAASSRHLYMVTPDGKCDDGNHGGCWHDVNRMAELDSGAVRPLSKHDALAEFLQGNTGKYWDVDDYRN